MIKSEPKSIPPAVTALQTLQKHIKTYQLIIIAAISAKNIRFVRQKKPIGKARSNIGLKGKIPL